MSILIKSAKIVDARSKFNGKIQDILIDKGKIQEISSNISDSKGKEKIILKNLHVSPGWFDSSVCFGEPGLAMDDADGDNVTLKAAGTTGLDFVLKNCLSRELWVCLSCY